jgi:hypothetical protein
MHRWQQMRMRLHTCWNGKSFSSPAHMQSEWERSENVGQINFFLFSRARPSSQDFVVWMLRCFVFLACFSEISQTLDDKSCAWFVLPQCVIRQIQVFFLNPSPARGHYTQTRVVIFAKECLRALLAFLERRWWWKQSETHVEGLMVERSSKLVHFCCHWIECELINQSSEELSAHHAE